MLKSLITASLVALSLNAYCLSAPVYVGSNEKQERLTPRIYQRSDGEGGTEYESEVVVAHADYRVAVFYTFNRSRGPVQLAINLRQPIQKDKPVVFYLRGGSSLEDALNQAYGSPENSPGYIYALDPKGFQHEEGMAIQELASHDSFERPEAQVINRRQEIQRLSDSGQIRLDWRP